MRRRFNHASHHRRQRPASGREFVIAGLTCPEAGFHAHQTGTG